MAGHRRGSPPAGKTALDDVESLEAIGATVLAEHCLDPEPAKVVLTDSRGQRILCGGARLGNVNLKV